MLLGQTFLMGSCLPLPHTLGAEWPSGRASEGWEVGMCSISQSFGLISGAHAL